MTRRAEDILDQLEVMFPAAHCELNHNDVYQLTVAVALSAQTPDAAVNKVTPALFRRYPDANALAKADIMEVQDSIKTLGLYRHKASNLVAMAQTLVSDDGGKVPDDRQKLEALPGIGRKCANVILAVGFGQPALAVDTHVHRVAIRLKMAPADADVGKVEQYLLKQIPPQRWSRAHHLLIFFGRYLCHAQQPECWRCPFYRKCGYQGRRRQLEGHRRG